jgi:hypothetical protein
MGWCLSLEPDMFGCPFCFLDSESQSIDIFPPRDAQEKKGKYASEPLTRRMPNPLDRRFWHQPATRLIACSKGSMNGRKSRVRNAHVHWIYGDVGTVAPPLDGYNDVHDDEIWWSKKELQFRRNTNVHELDQQRDVQVFDRECEAVYERIFQFVHLFYNYHKRGPITTYGTLVMSKVQMKSYLTPDLMMGIAFGYRGLELGGLEGRRERTEAALEAVRDYYLDSGCGKKNKTARRNRLNSVDALALAVEEVSVIDRLWSQVVALGEEMIVNTA